MNKMPKPVEDVETYWSTPPPVLSECCKFWVDQFLNKGWYPNRRIRAGGYYEQTEQYGVYVWEWLHILWPILREKYETKRPDMLL